MRIAQINATYGDADSTGRNVKELNRFFKKEGHAVCSYVVSLNNENETVDESVHFFSGRTDQKIHGFLSRLTGLQGYFSVGATRKLIKDIREFNPDVIILNVLHSNCINFRMLFNFIAEQGIPVIFVLHDVFYFTGHCCHYIDVNCYRWKEKCGNCPSVHDWNISWFFDTSAKVLRDKKKWYRALKYKGVVAVSHWLEDAARESILSGSRFTTIYNWVDQKVFTHTERRPEIYQRLGDRKTALAVASVWDEKKGLSDIIALAESCPEIEIIMIGPVPDAVIPVTNIMPVGKVYSSQEMAEYYSAADVFINPSIQETFGKTTAEALSCGTPVVAYRTTACKELVDSDRGELVPLGNMKGFIEKTRRVIVRGKSNYFNSAVSFAQKNFQLENNARRYLDFITKLVEDSKF